ncbi:TRAP transporter, 4TM/12TM fusion protein [uncultured delta proteobacterium]|uniref:TRAP transporter, 4TM/12TM fusion protein n=1 Tax=uncultured delta proteobacterium TaxID=34034 RepID=A0A212IYK6_9DELT|nr:TRAP transporter, 4TM/12TM fusion protein [uncultured delta proteobacterium]
MTDDKKNIDLDDIDRSGLDGNIASETRIDLSKVERVEIDDPETGKKRVLAGWQFYVVAALALAASCFHLYTAAFGLLDAMTQRSIHFLFMGSLVFLLYPVTAKRPKGKIELWDWACAILMAVCCANILFNFEAIAMREGRATQSDIILGVLMILLVIEATRRSMGWPLPIVATVAILYGIFGPYFPGMLGHRGFSIDTLAPFMYLRTDGIFGVPLGVSASFIFLFCLFGAFLTISGAGQFFIDLAVALTGRSLGGAGKAAVVASGLMGMVSGSSTGNAVTTGSFTIPLMKQSGYTPTFAGAVVACASTGGQVMPPVMGAAAFIMAQFLAVSYWEVVVSAAIPATLYFISIIMMVHFRAGRRRMKRMDASELPKALNVLKQGWHLLLPIVALVIILAFGYSPTMAVFWSIIAIVVFSWLGPKQHRMTPKMVLHALISGGMGAIEVATACACSGIIIGIIAISGVGLAFSSFVLDLSFGILPLALFWTMIGSIILGMGVPTTAQYIITSTLAAPALANMGISMHAAHLFCLYFGVLADVTPPVALATYASAGIARSDPLKTGFTALATAAAGFVVPYMFVYNPYLMLQGGNVLDTVVGTVTALIGMVGLASAVQGFLVKDLNIAERMCLFMVPFLVIWPTIPTNILGAAIVAGIFILQGGLKRKAQTAAA